MELNNVLKDLKIDKVPIALVIIHWTQIIALIVLKDIILTMFKRFVYQMMIVYFLIINVILKTLINIMLLLLLHQICLHSYLV